LENNIKENPYKKVFNLNSIYSIASVLYIAFILIYIGTHFASRPRYGFAFFGASLIIFMLRALKGEYTSIKKILDNKIIKEVFIISITLLAAAVAIYFWINFPWLTYERAGSPNNVDLIFGGIALIMIILSVFIYSGPILAVGAIFFILYGFFGNYAPGILSFKGITLSRMIDILSSQIYRGIFGDLLQMGGTLLAVFIIFAGMVHGLGGFDIIIKISLFIARISKYLVTQSAVFASMTMGMFSGSGAANVAGTGSFTIPLMKRYNVPAYFAGAIEAVASAGGQIMPPIMGAAAFLMAEYLGVSYIKIALMGILPALLFFAGVSFSVYHLSRIVKIKVPAAEKLTNNEDRKEETMAIAKQERRKLFTSAFPFALSLIVLLVLMSVFKFGAVMAGFFTTIQLIVISFLTGLILKTEPIKLYLKRFINMVLKGAIHAAGTVMELGLMLSIIEIGIVILSYTGLASKINFMLLSMGRGQLPLLLLLSAVVCILLGCVTATVAVYILAMVTVVPALLRVGIDPIVAHFYVFWFAILGLITPPVAGNVIAACRIAKSDFLETAKESIKIGIGLLLIPILMVAHPELLIHSAKTPIIFIMGLITVYAISFTFYGNYIIPRIKGLIIRLLIGAVSVYALLAPINETLSYILTGGVVLSIIIIHIKYRKNIIIL